MPVAPSAPSTPTQPFNRQNRSANSTPTRSRRAARSESNYEPSTVKERIRAWQNHGNEADSSPGSEFGNGEPKMTPAEENSEDEETKDEKAIEQHTSKGKEDIVGKGSVSRQKKTKWVDPANREWVRTTRSRSTPRKRVVSDEHWKRRPSLPRANGESPQNPHALQGKEGKIPEKATYYPKNEPRIVSEYQREDREARWQKLRTERDREVYGCPQVEDEGGSICASTPSSTPCREFQKGDITSGKDQEEDEDIENKEMPIRDRNEPTLRKKQTKECVPTEKDNGRHRRRSSHVEPPLNSHETARTSQARRVSVKSRKGGILGHVLDESKKMFAKPDPAFPAPRIPSIEAWLEETPDPFLDGEQGDGPPIAMPAPLKTRTRRHRSSTHDAIHEDDEATCDYLRTSYEEEDEGGGSRRRRKRRPQTPTEDAFTAQEHRNDADKLASPAQSFLHSSAEQSPTSLKRSAARVHRRRRKSSTPILEPSPPDVLSPNVDLPPPPCELINAFDTLETPVKYKKTCPQTGVDRLSTIASVETFQTGSHSSQTNENQDALSRPTGLKRKLTTHEDLMSVLSLPRAGRSTRSLKSVRSNHHPQYEATVDGLLLDLAVEEARYMRELRTLVDGVIPVLLHCVLSRSDSAIAAGLFASSGSPEDDLRVTQPIYDMGVCLGRIESLHKRIPLKDTNDLLAWAKGAEKVYSEYFHAWRTGFQDVVVNLTPADEETRSKTDGDMSRDENGDVINEDGEKADVAFLLKRPLVRVRKMSKFFSKLCSIMPSSKSTDVSEIFIDLAAFARRRSNEEQGRQEDEAATRIDVRRTRDLNTMTLAHEVAIKKTGSVRARDPFSLTLHHSSGQRYDCQVELLLRDNVNKTAKGDLLICELDNSEKWLLFSPVEMQYVSARQGDFPGEIILMIRFPKEGSFEPYQLLSLQADSEQTSSDWIHMLGLVPLPPKLQRSHSFLEHHKHWSESTVREPDGDFTTSSVLSTKEVPKPQDVDAPIGERTTAHRYENSSAIHSPTHHANSIGRLFTPARNNLANNEGLARESLPRTPPKTSQTPARTPDSSKTIRGNPDGIAETDLKPLKRSRAISRRAKGGDESPSSIGSDDFRSKHNPFVSTIDTGYTNQTERASTDTTVYSGVDSETKEVTEPLQKVSSPGRPHYHRNLSSTPSAKLPIIPRLRPSKQYDSPAVNDTNRDQWSGGEVGQESNASKLRESNSQQNSLGLLRTEDVGSSLSGSRPASPPSPPPPPPPPHLSPTSSQVSLSPTPPKKSPLFGRTIERRSSSPLKHEYAPSTASDSTSDSASAFNVSSSETSEDDEVGDLHTPLPFVPLRTAYKTSSPSSAPTLATASLTPSNSASQGPYRSVPSQPCGPKSKSIATIYSWSDRGMWNQLHSDECSIIVTPGLISAYQMSAAHSGSKPVVDPKTISGTASDTSSYLHEEDSGRDHPLIALELTPLVPIRRGTALDISIRSPPTTDSRIQSSNNIMFRSRSADECEVLYSLINYARINNPTYIALQNARPPIQPPVNFNINGQGGRASSVSRTGSWLFGIGGSRKGPSSFRASSAPPPGSITAASDNSLANSFSSAMRRFGSSTMFSLNRSSVVRKARGTGTPSLHSTESGTTATGGSGSGKTSPAPTQLLVNAAGGAEKTLGINNIKIRLYTRDQPGQPWTHLGPARLSVLSASVPLVKASRDGGLNGDGPSPPGSGGLGDSRLASSSGVVQADRMDTLRTPRASTQKGPRLPSSSYTPHRKHGNGREKRVLIVAKSKSKSKPPAVLLDECLGESCFNRVGRIGMAINVWEEELEMKKIGGVVTGKDKIYMVQFHGEAEAAWVFGSVGRMKF